MQNKFTTISVPIGLAERITDIQKTRRIEKKYEVIEQIMDDYQETRNKKAHKFFEKMRNQTKNIKPLKINLDEVINNSVGFDDDLLV